ncbi:MAG: PIN domain nuclease [Bryobacteraceae bacterium]
MGELLFLRASVIVTLAILAFFFQPFNLPGNIASPLAAGVGLTLVIVELHLRRVSAVRLLGGAAGTIAGLFAAVLFGVVLGQMKESETVAFMKIGITIAAAYIGLSVGAAKANSFTLPVLGVPVDDGSKRRSEMNVLDTSVVIDGRIADIAETGFLDGTLAVPQFVLRELQLVADSSDSLKRNRGRRGLDILQRLQKLPQLRVEILEEDFHQIREVDMKLVELGKLTVAGSSRMTSTLNKVAQLHGVHVLNINELANALRPIVLPGESMRVFILKGRQRVQPGGSLPGRWNYGGRGQCQAYDC